MTNRIDDLMTVNDLARECGVPEWRVIYIIRSRGIRHVRRIGVVRLFRADVLDVVRAELAAIAGKRNHEPVEART